MKIVVIGAGVGGVLIVQQLKKKLPDAEFTLIDNNDQFVFTPRLTELFSEMIPEKYIIRPTEVFEGGHVRVIISKAAEVNLKKQTVSLANKQKVVYDILVFAQGARTNFFGMKNPEKYCMQFKEYQDVYDLKKKITTALTAINKGTRKKYHIALVGGGPTGTELAFALRDFIKHHAKEFPNVDHRKVKVSIFQGGETLVPGLHPYIVKKAHSEAKKGHIDVYTKHIVKDVKKNLLVFDNTTVPADVILWVAGVTPNVIKCVPKIELSRGAIPVTPTLQLKGFPNVFAIGDCNFSLNPEKKPYPPTAQIAQQHAFHVVDNIVHLVKKQPLQPFTYKMRGWFLALGHHKTAAQLFFLHFNGMLGWMMRDQYYKKVFRTLTKK